MAKHVIILGAGASVACGAPVMENFLDRAQALYANNKDLPQRASFERVFHAISDLQRVHSKAQFDLDNIESIFTAFEIGCILGRLPGISSVTELAELVDHLRWLMVVTLEQTM